jgi:methyltransferase-like protein 23
VKDVKKQNLPHDKILAQAILQTIMIGGREISLFVPPAEVVQQAYKRGEIPFPFWSKVWPAAIALAEYLVLHPQLTSGKKIVELGAGLGLPSFVAAQTAAAVLCTDHAPEAVQLAERSAKHLGLQNFRAAVLDWHMSRLLLLR